MQFQYSLKDHVYRSVFFYYRGVLSVTDHSPVVGAAVEDCVEGNDGVVPPNLKPPKITKNESPESTLKIYNEQKK